MNTFKKKSLYAALAGVGALGVTGAANAVSVNPDGLGQVLIYPYYTVREAPTGSPQNSLLSVVNSTASAKAVKVRFLEGKNSREVLDFNLYLSKKDVWTAAVIPTASGAGVFTKDKSCTTPTVSNDAGNPTAFVNFAYSGDGADASLDRTREGYVEIIEMGDILAGSKTETGVTHVSGVPPCTNLGGTAPSSDVVAGSGGLFGGISIINVNQGNDVATTATALESFSQTSLWTDPGNILPNLANVNPKVSVVTTGSRTIITDWSATSNAADPVSAILMHDNVYNEFVLDPGTKSGTDWVITMPTKNQYYTSTGVVTKLFQRNFGASGACDDVGLTQYDREEATIVSQTSFSPPPPTQTDSICWEVNIITFNNSNVLGSTNKANIPTNFQNGWVALNFPLITSAPPAQGAGPLPRHQLVATGGVGTTVFNTATGSATAAIPTATYNGLPVLGFAVQTFANGAVGTPPILSNYSGVMAHRFTRSIAAP